MYGTRVRWSYRALLGVSVIATQCGLNALATGLGAPLCNAMSDITLAMGVGQVGLKNTSKMLGIKVHKHDSERLLAASKLNNIIDLISKAIKMESLALYGANGANSTASEASC